MTKTVGGSTVVAAVSVIKTSGPLKKNLASFFVYRCKTRKLSNTTILQHSAII